MPANRWIRQLSHQETLNFLLTNRIPRAFATRCVGRLSRIENRWFTRAAMTCWQWFADDLRLHESPPEDYRSLRACFTRPIKPDARPIDPDPDVLVSPCDAVIGAHGEIADNQLYQIKGFPYTLEDLLGDAVSVERYRNGRFMTLRLKSSMYHRFHAPEAARLGEIHYISGDTWNVNPIALRRVEKLYCKNERAVLEFELPDHPEEYLTLVPVAAILVASMRFHCLDQDLDIDYRGPRRLPCEARFERGQEVGYFQHGSTIILLASPGFEFLPELQEGEIIRMGRPLMRKRKKVVKKRSPTT